MENEQSAGGFISSCLRSIFGGEKKESFFQEPKISESENLLFLKKLAESYNFESEDLDKYICVLFDLLLYKYPVLANGVFELLVRLFTRKRTFLENLMKIQMLENPKSIRVLREIQKYYSELRKFVEDADQWLNKSTLQSRQIKQRAIFIFKFFSQKCQEDMAQEDEEEEDEFQENMSKREAPLESSPEAAENFRADVPLVSQTIADNQSKRSNVSTSDFILFNEQQVKTNKENQRLLSSFGIENLAMFFIKYRVDRNVVDDPFYLELIHQCYDFLVNYVRNNFQNQIKVHDHIEIFLRDIDKNPLICLLIYEMFKDNKRFLTLNVSKILRQIIISAEEASLISSKKALYLKLLDVFCKFEDKLVRPNQQEIVINFTRDISKNNLIYLFSNEGLPQLSKLVQGCLPKQVEQLPPELTESSLLPQSSGTFTYARVSMEVFNVIVCLDLMGVCCEGKSDLAEIKCQNEIVNMQTSLYLYSNSLNCWTFKASLLRYISHVYLDSGNDKLFPSGGANIQSLNKIFELIRDDVVAILENWDKEEADCLLLMPDGTQTSLIAEAKEFALGNLPQCFKAFMKNSTIEASLNMFPLFQDITTRIAKMYYMTQNERFKANSLDLLQYINGSEKYSRLLENIQHPANQNIYMESKKNSKAGQKNLLPSIDLEEQGDYNMVGHKSSQLQAKLIQMACSNEMNEMKEREFEDLVLWVTNIDQRIGHIMSRGKDSKAFQNVNFNSIVSSFMTLLDSRCMSKDLHITGLTLLRKLIEVENKELVTPAADWEDEEWDKYEKIIRYRQNQLVEIGCVEFLCKHIQEVDDEDVLEELFMVCITLLLGGNKRCQDAFFSYFIQQDHDNFIMMKLKGLIMDQFDHSKKYIGDKTAKLAMIHKIKQRNQMKEERQQKLIQRQAAESIEVKRELPGSPPPQMELSNSENLLTFDESMAGEEDEDNGQQQNKVDEMFLANQVKSVSIVKTMRLLRFVQLLTEGHHTELQNFMREQILANGLVNQKSFDFISYISQMLAIYEKQYINCYSTALGQQIISTLIELVQGPCRKNQSRLVEAKIIDCCRDLIQQGQQSKTEMSLRGFTSEQKYELLDSLKYQSIKLLLSIIEGSVDEDIYRQIADSFDDFQILTMRMETIFDLFVRDDLGLNPETASLPQIMGALQKNSFNGPVTEGFNIYCLINQLAIALPDVNEKMKKFSSSNIYQFFQLNTGNVEVQKDEDIMTIYFPIQPVTKFLTQTTKENFSRQVNRESNQHKIIDLIAKTPEFIDEMEHLEERSHDYIKITPERLNFFRDLSTVIAVAISFVAVGFYRYDRIEKADGSSDYTSYIDAFPNLIILWLGYAQMITSMTLLIGFMLNKINIIVKSGWRKKCEQNMQKLATDIKYILKPLEPPFGELKAKNLPIQAVRCLMLTDGPYSNAFKDENGKTDFVYKAVAFEYRWICMSFIMQTGGFVFILFYLAFSLQGLFQSPIFYSFHLIDVINRFPQLQNVIQSVTLNGNQLLLTAMLGIIIIYIYSAMAFIFVADTFYDDDIEGGLLNRKGDSICQSMLHCFLSAINYGLRGGGGVGDFLPTQTAVPENEQGFYFRSFYDWTNFMILITILLNIIFGIIIDSFAQLRDKKTQTDEDIKNICFICNIEKQIFDRDTEEGFEFHTQNDHDLWQYLNFIIHLKSIDSTDLNGTESYILELFEKEDISWFPMQKSQRLLILKKQKEEKKHHSFNATHGAQEGEDGLQNPGGDDPIEGVNISLNALEEKISEVYQKF